MKVEGQHWHLTSTHIYIGLEGVAARCPLSQAQQDWYRMSETVVPHISLALPAGKEARELGPMTKRGAEATDWKDSDLPGVQWSQSTSMYRIALSPAINSSMLERV